MSRLGIIGDTHLPFVHPMYLRFCEDTFEQYNVTKIHHIGDVVDGHAISFWEHDPDGHSAGREAELAYESLEAWKESFPVATVTIGNHDERHFRVARKAGLPTRYLKDYKGIWDTPRWKWDFVHMIDGVYCTHGTNVSGKDAAFNLASQKRTSVAIGHTHTHGGVKWHSNYHDTIFGLNVGCGIDIRSYVFAYGRDLPIRPMLGCGIIIDGWQPIFVPMRCGEGEKYNRRRA